MRSTIKQTTTLIRRMRAADVRQAAALYATVYDRVAIGEHWTKTSAMHFMKYWLKRQPDLCFVALRNRRVVGGFFGGIKPWWDGNHLVDGEIFVDLAWHRQGIATQLSVTLYNAALKKYHITNIDLETYSKNGFPLSWYRSIGFTQNNFLKIVNGAPRAVLKKLTE